MLNVIRFTAIVSILIVGYGVYCMGASSLASATTAQAQQMAQIEAVQ